MLSVNHETGCYLDRKENLSCCGGTFLDESNRQSKRPRQTKRPVRASDFGVLGERHPYGVLPSGNRFFDAASEKNNTVLALLSDEECWNTILSYCSGSDLSKVVQTCRFLYVAGHQPELWRDLVLRRCDSADIVISQTGASWRDTYVILFHGGHFKIPHEPMKMEGVYSEYHYRLHSCRAFAIPDCWLNGTDDNGFKIPIDQMTETIFKEEFEKPNIPLLITGGAQNWKACQRWKDRQYFATMSTGKTFRATSGAAVLPANFTLESYFTYCDSTHLEESPLYLFDRSALNIGSPLWNDYMEDLRKTNPYWDPDRVSENCHDLFQLLGEGRRPDHTWLIVGPKRSGSVFHIDPNATHAWNATICGRKRWIFYPPGVTPPGIHPSRDGDEVALPLSIGEWLFSFWEEHAQRKQMSPPNERPIEFTAMPGDIVFVPHGWWHSVINLDDFNVAITHNYVSESNLGNVLKFLSRKRDQVSGCRDRAESIKPDNLFDGFVSVLNDKFPLLLEQAQNEMNWTCKAWSDPCKVEVSKLTKTVMDMAKTESGEFSFSFL